MIINTTQIIGYISLPNDTVRDRSEVIFTMTGFDTDADDNAVVVPTPVRAQILQDGSIDVLLWPNQEGVRTTFYRVTFSIYNGNQPYLFDGGLIEVPATGGPYDLNDLLPILPPPGASVEDYIAQLAASVAAAEDAADRAEDAAASIVDSEWQNDGVLVAKPVLKINARSFITASQDGADPELVHLDVAGWGAGSGFDADKLDGQHGAYYQDASNLDAGTVPDARLPARLGPYATVITDWDDVSEGGDYTGDNAANGPGAGLWLGGAAVYDTNWITVTAHQFTGDSSADTKTMRREKNSGVWGAWYPVVSSEDEVKALAAPHGKALARARWNGTGVITIHDASNISSIVRNSTGNFTVNFATPMPGSYTVLCNGRDDGTGTAESGYASAMDFTASSVRVITQNDGNDVLRDLEIINMVVIGD